MVNIRIKSNPYLDRHTAFQLLLRQFRRETEHINSEACRRRYYESARDKRLRKHKESK